MLVMIVAFHCGLHLAKTHVGRQLTNLKFRCPVRQCTMATLGTPASAQEERFDVLHEDGTPKGFSKARSLVHRDGDWHRSTHIWILSSDGEVLVQRRAAGKDTFPVRYLNFKYNRLLDISLQNLHTDLISYLFFGVGAVGRICSGTHCGWG